MAESFGARLRKHRESRQVDLSAIAEQTKIKLSLFEGLERDDISHWPSGIFRRAYIRAYAHAIGLDPDVVVREFLEVHPDPEEVAPISAIAEANGVRTSGGPPTRFRYMVGAAMGSLSRLRRSPAAEPPPVAGTSGAVPASQTPFTIVEESAPSGPDLLAVADVCTALSRVETAEGVQSLLQEVAAILDATGLIVWIWDATAEELRPALVHGYSDQVVAQLPAVTRDADNVTAAAFRLGQPCVLERRAHTNGALVVPLLTPAGCAGVLALELEHGAEQAESVRAVATIFTALLAQLIGGGTAAAVLPQAVGGAHLARALR